LIRINAISAATHQKTPHCNIPKGGAIMRALHHLIAVAAILLFVFGLKIVASTTEADASVVPSTTLNVLQMQMDYVNYLPAQQIRDMTFVFG
jgi:hypothetical protein